MYKQWQNPSKQNGKIKNYTTVIGFDLIPPDIRIY